MEIKESQHRDIALLELAGSVDTRAAQELEAKLADLLDKGTRLFAIGLSELEQLTSSGLRVLVMLAKKLAGLDGGLVLFAMNSKVKTIFEISGLLDLFPVVATRKEAFALLSSSKRMSKLSLLATKLLDGDKDTDARGDRHGRGAGRADSRLSAKVARLLSPRHRSKRAAGSASEDSGNKPIKPGPRRD